MSQFRPEARRRRTIDRHGCIAFERATAVREERGSDSESLQTKVYEQNVTGSPGTGKTHALLAIGLAACTRGFRTIFVTAAELLMSLIAAKREGRLDRKLRSYERYDIVLVDELGYIPFEREATDLLFQIISQRYERGSIAITTNLAFSDWTNIFPDPMAATAVIDRLVHHGTVFEFTGESQRLKARQRRLSSPPPTEPKKGPNKG